MALAKQRVAAGHLVLPGPSEPPGRSAPKKNPERQERQGPWEPSAVWKHPVGLARWARRVHSVQKAE